MAWITPFFVRFYAFIRALFLSTKPLKNAENYSCIIVGAGAAGLNTAVQLQKTGFKNFTILEKQKTVGGTWAANSYPGLACDVYSHYYSFSYFLKHDWPRMASSGRELHLYFKKLAEHFGLNDKIKFNTEVKSAIWNEESKVWEVTTSAGELLRANFLVGATGFYLYPSIPSFKNASTFKGKTLHTAQWDHAYQYAGKRIGVIGTGASALQLIPGLHTSVDQLYVFQRTPSWVLDHWNFYFGDFIKTAFQYIPGLMRSFRTFIFWSTETWYALCFTNIEKSVGYKLFKKLSLNAMTRRIKDPELRKKLIPKYEMGCKRIGFSDDFINSITSPKSHVITSGIEEFYADGVITKSGEKVELDCIVYATGFNMLKSSVEPFTVIGKNKLSLNDHWGDYPKALYGCTTTEFPNFFKVYGPNTSVGHTSVLFVIEAGVNYLVDCIRKVTDEKKASIEVKSGVLESYYGWLENKMSAQIFAGGCTSYYQNSKGINWMLWPTFVTKYWWYTLVCQKENYQIE